jgi:Ca-activated chloride channel family protein
MNRAWKTVLFSLCFFLLYSCSGPRDSLRILSGSENESLKPLIDDFCAKNHCAVDMSYKGSVDIMLDLGKQDVPFDAVWPANDIWISLGDKSFKVKRQKSIMMSPVVFGVKKSLAEKLGFVGKTVRVKDLLSAIEGKKLSFAMTSASQPNSGCAAYIGFLYALATPNGALSIADLHKKELKENIRSLLSGINRSSGSSAWLKDLFLKGDFDAMVNYESLIIETNKELVQAGREPLYIVYPVDGLVLADSPLGYINQGDQKKEALFSKFQDYLLSPETQSQIVKLGRRAGFPGTIEGDPKTFNPDWGIDVKKILSPIAMPSGEVLLEAINLYQTEFRKPSATVFCLDFSGSMEGNGVSQVRDAMSLLLTPEKAREYLLQPGSEDVTTIIAFNDALIKSWTVRGNNPDTLGALLDSVKSLEPRGGTDIYSPIIAGLDSLQKEDASRFLRAVILMTDGKSNSGRSFGNFETSWKQTGNGLPVFSIMFGEASREQLGPLAETTLGNVFDGRTDLIAAFRKAKGFN